MNVWGDFGSVIGTFFFWGDDEVALFPEPGVAVPVDKKDVVGDCLGQVNTEWSDRAAVFCSEDWTSIVAANKTTFEGERPDPEELDWLPRSTKELLDRRRPDVVRFLYGGSDTGTDGVLADD